MATLKIIAKYGDGEIYTNKAQNEQFNIIEDLAKNFMSDNTDTATAAATLIDNFGGQIEGLTNNFYRYCEVTRKISTNEILAQ